MCSLGPRMVFPSAEPVNSVRFTVCDETGRTLESDRVQVVKDNLLILLLDLFLLPKNDIALPLNRRLFELGVLENVGENVDRLGHVLVERLGVVDGLLAGSVGVEVGAEVFDLELELGLRSRLGSLERKVLFRVRPSSLPFTLRLTSRKWAVPLALGASALEPASIQRPTVEVDAPGMVSVETLRPFERVDVLVTGSAATVTGCTAARFLASDCVFFQHCSSATNNIACIWGRGRGRGRLTGLRTLGTGGRAMARERMRDAGMAGGGRRGGDNWGDKIGDKGRRIDAHGECRGNTANPAFPRVWHPPSSSTYPHSTTHACIHHVRHIRTAILGLGQPPVLRRPAI